MSQPPVRPQPGLGMKKQKKRPRLVVHETVLHQLPGERPTSSKSRFLRWLTTDEQPFVRHFSCPQTWTPLETGWLESASMLVLSHEGPSDSPPLLLGLLVSPPELPPNQRTMHSPPRAAPFVAQFATVRPGGSLRFEPTSLADLRIYCAAPVKCVLRLTPE